MKVEKLTKEIRTKYPKVWEKLKKEYENKNIDPHIPGLYYDFFDDGEICLYSRYSYLLPFSMLYGLLEDFFEKNGFAIEIKHYSHGFCYDLKKIKNSIPSNCSEKKRYQINSKQKAKQLAILKACSFLEDQLEKVKK